MQTPWSLANCMQTTFRHYQNLYWEMHCALTSCSMLFGVWIFSHMITVSPTAKQVGVSAEKWRICTTELGDVCGAVHSTETERRTSINRQAEHLFQLFNCRFLLALRLKTVLKFLDVCFISKCILSWTGFRLSYACTSEQATQYEYSPLCLPWKLFWLQKVNLISDRSNGTGFFLVDVASIWLSVDTHLLTQVLNWDTFSQKRSLSSHSVQ